MFLRKMTIGTRLALAFGVIVAIMVLVSAGGTLLAQRSRDELAGVIEAARAKEDLAANMKALALEQSSVMRNIGLHTDIKAMQSDEDAARNLGKQYDDAGERMARLPLQPAERKLLETLSKLDKDIDKPFLQALGLSTSFRNEEAAKILMAEIDPIIQKTLAELNRLIEMQKKANREATQSAMVTSDRLATTTYVVEALVGLFAVLDAWTITRSITGPLGESVAVARPGAPRDPHPRLDSPGGGANAAPLAAPRAVEDGGRGLA